jgi:hypothetical protein
MSRKKSTGKSKIETNTPHPETQKPRGKTGAPGPEGSTAPTPGKDERNRHDQDGNGAQLRR